MANAVLVTTSLEYGPQAWFLAVESHSGERLYWWATEALLGDETSCRRVLDTVLHVAHPVRLHDDVRGLEDRIVLGGATLCVDPGRDRFHVTLPSGDPIGPDWTVDNLARDPTRVLAQVMGLLAALSAP
jgi:hypothetical protein